LQTIFEIEDHQKKNILKDSGKKWKDFKNSLTRRYISKSLIESPPPNYDFIEQEVWDDFSASRTTTEFQVNTK